MDKVTVTHPKGVTKTKVDLQTLKDYCDSLGLYYRFHNDYDGHLFLEVDGENKNYIFLIEEVNEEAY